MQRPRYLTRSNTLTREREKRGLDPADGDDLSPEPKRQKVPALARYDILMIFVVVIIIVISLVDLGFIWGFLNVKIGYFV